MNEKFRNWHNITMLSYVGIIITIVIWYFIISPPQFTLSMIFSILYVLVLFIPLGGLLKKTTGVYMWSSYLILIYFGHAIIETWAQTDLVQKGLAITELVLSSVYFLAATLCYRQARQRDRQQSS